MKWEYTTLANSDGEYLDDSDFNMMGQEGWEMVSCQYSRHVNRIIMAVFKRPIAAG